MTATESHRPPKSPRAALARIFGAGPKLAVFAVFVVLSVRFFLIVSHYSVDIFFGDHWSFEDATLFQKHSWLDIVRWEVGPIRQGLGGLLLKVFEPLIHWNQRYETFGIAGIIVCACIAGVWLKYRLFGKIIYSDVIIPLLFLTPVQWETLIGANNPSHGPLPLLLSILYCLAWTIPDDRWKHAAVLSLNLLLIYTGFGLFMGFVTPLLLGLEFFHQRNRLAAISLGLASISLGSFFIGYRLDAAVACFSPEFQGDLHYIVYIGLMFSSFVTFFPTPSTAVPAILVGSCLLLIAALTAAYASLRLLREGTRSLKPLIASILLGYALVFCAATAYGRTCLGRVPAPRYMTYLLLAFFGLYLAALSTVRKLERREFVGFILILSLLSSARIAPRDARAMLTRSEQRRTWKVCYLSTHDIQECDVRAGSFIYDTPEPPDLKPKLDYLEQHRLGLFYSRGS